MARRTRATGDRLVVSASSDCSGAPAIVAMDEWWEEAGEAGGDDAVAEDEEEEVANPFADFAFQA